ncbi:hypothetical protein IQ279_22035 [Streptomyces verrucosisporus]|uniref:hypothetical protein n=1 Tax=Streptomyces verrucosisporus TaxID=1695161 RepID=UPI0019CFF63D|nr:hypothetical protein [Streptomyces verrucosisporus]MBN3932271.1 hypothetical protein [Streptomyces verrucosisporus]
MATTATRTEHPPIYEGLLEELGDVPTETREAAERILRETREVLDWREPGEAQHRPE